MGVLPLSEWRQRRSGRGGGSWEVGVSGKGGRKEGRETVLMM